MFLRATKRKKDGKIHHYWSVVENVRVGRRVFQRRALHLGELNDSQHAEWQRAIEAIDENGRVTQLKLFPEERAPKSDDGSIVRIQMNRLSVGNMRNWGEVWLGLQLWDMLELDDFWSSRIDKSRKGTDWPALLKAIVIETKEHCRSRMICSSIFVIVGRDFLALPAMSFFLILPVHISKWTA